MTGSGYEDLTRTYFDVWRREGLEAFLALLPDDVEFVPYSGRGTKLSGKAPLREFWAEREAAGERVDVELHDVELLDGDTVLVVGALRRRSPGRDLTDQLAWLYSFRDGRLWRASGHASVAEARQAARFLHTERVELSRSGPHFRIVLHEEPQGRTVLSLEGELDLATAPGLSEAIDRAARSGHVLVDLSGLTFMDSSGLRALLDAAQRARALEWRLELRRGPAVVQRVLELAGVESLLPFEALTPPAPGAP